MKLSEFKCKTNDFMARTALCGIVCAIGCAPRVSQDPYVPSSKYAGLGAAIPTVLEQHGQAGIGRSEAAQTSSRLAKVTSQNGDARASLRQVQYEGDLGPDVRVIRSANRGAPPYRQPLELGDPGVTASLWRESQSGNEPFRDFRAWQPMDLVTIIVNEQSLGRHNADTEVKSKSQYMAAIENLLGLESQPANWSRPPNMASLIKASTQNDFKGEGRTVRQGQLTAQISAVVAEVLPSGLLRIEGEKIIAVNNEEQIMAITGLVRQRDINSNNEVNASQIAQIRIDYYGKGTVGEAQYGGWLGRLLRILWPF